ncbi:MAG: hypothetical protein CMF58_03390 [Lentimicrobiaceae bacterium]|nr:hypothetical protein [Lentimicrobiaceae bacterium]MDG1901609.1 hypothetical protein [Bacteroidales bacterium]|tara:strand:- start:72 stop:1625 length:1554 start_codon:yes stop_codon:yes gene_type:complete
MIKQILTLISTIAFMAVVSQSLDAIRIEVPADLNAEAYNIEPLGKNGVIIFYVSNELDAESKRKWYFGLFDTNLDQQWLKFVSLTDNLEYITTRKSKGKIYFLFKNSSSDRSGNGYYEIVTYEIKNQSFTKITGSIPGKSEYAGFDIINDMACLALNLKKQETDLVFINLNNGDLTPVNIDKGIPGYIHSVYSENKSKTFYIAMKQNVNRRYISEHILAYSILGERKFNLKVSNTEPLKYFDDFTFISDGSEDVNIMGTYSIITGKNLSFKDVEDNDEDRSAGMFFLSLSGENQETLKYHDFMGFGNITGAIGIDNFNTSKLTVDSANTSRNLVTVAFNLNSPLAYRAPNNTYIFSVEVYQPYYRTETRMDYDFYGRPYPYTYNIFSGYDFYDVIIAGISKKGELIWSNDFRIEDMLTYSLKRKSVVFNDDNFITLAYVNNGNVISQTVEGSTDIDRSAMKIGTDFPQDKVTQEENSHIIGWYDDVFIIYGYQKLRNRTLEDKSTRNIFYVNKIAYK